jgi:hypothetical protein
MGRIRQLISKGHETGRCLEMDSIRPISRDPNRPLSYYILKSRVSFCFFAQGPPKLRGGLPGHVAVVNHVM